MAANYDNAAWFYDRLSRLVFGNRLKQAQEFLLDHIPPGSRILIAGGGTGSILEWLAEKHPTGLTVVYAEISEKMTALSKKRYTGSNRVSFFTGAAEQMPQDQPFDIILTPFLLDNFSENYLHQFMQTMNAHIKPGGLWLCSDFQINGRWWHPVLLKIMYYFFKTLGCVEVTQMPDIPGKFRTLSYEGISRKNFYGNFITAGSYEKRQV